MLRYANPTKFMQLSTPLLPWLGAAALASLATGLYLGLRAPPDYQQGETVRVMFLHVPAAWTAMMAYGLMATASLVGLVWASPSRGPGGQGDSAAGRALHRARA